MSEATVNKLSELMDVLDEERTAIKGGAFSDFPMLTKKIDGLTDQVLHTSKNLDPITLDKLRIAAERNQRLLDAAAQGVAAARKRGAEIRGRALNIQTYNGSGQRSLMAPLTREFERRS
jgi:hypothetical protein